MDASVSPDASGGANAVLLQVGAFAVPYAGAGFAPRDVTLKQPLTAGSVVVVCFKGEDPGNIPTLTDLPGASNTFVSMDHQAPKVAFETDIFVGTVLTGGQTKIRVTRPSSVYAIQGTDYTNGGHVDGLSIGFYFHSAAGVARSVTFSAGGGAFRQGEPQVIPALGARA